MPTAAASAAAAAPATVLELLDAEAVDPEGELERQALADGLREQAAALGGHG